ncbi:hypothetical protein [uncultured Halopseudomonas sp.]|uniref:hypothetical protein n=1 Tax=uncultured Halopseudomonas sp. TaxID=2901193 RepID=UPI0030EC6D56
MIEDVFEGIFKLLGRFVSQIFIEVIFDILIKGSGYLIVKSFSKADPNPDGIAVVLTGTLFWIALAFGAYGLYVNIATSNA